MLMKKGGLKAVCVFIVMNVEGIKGRERPKISRQNGE